MKRCFLRMKPISPKMASGFRRWAAQHLEAGRNEKLALKILMDELEIRTWISRIPSLALMDSRGVGR